MGPLEEAIQEFTQKRLAVYKADPQQIVRDTRAAERATGDHAGRWLFELLQNSDDAGASEVLVVVENDTVYVADNGHGLKPEAVSAICGTDFSDKAAGTIGRKGVGFKSVFEVSRNPQVLTVDGGGIEFSPDTASAWLQQNNLYDGHVPHQWIPSFVAWDAAQRQDPQLSSLRACKTVVRLRALSPEKKQKVEELLMEWPPHALFAFRHLRQIKAPAMEVALTVGAGVCLLRDSRGQRSDQWRVARVTEHPPAHLLGVLGADERRAVSTDGVGFLIAAPLQNDCVVPTTDYLPVHVFYPTEQKGPVRLLLHAEFLVKSDRTALMPLDGNPLNGWVADRLAFHVCKFVNDSYRAEAPSSHAAMLVPFGDRASHPVAKDLWHRIADKAQGELRLADVEAKQRLTLDEARLISVSVRADLARTLLGATGVRTQLLHPAFDDDNEARKALTELGCKEVGDQHLMMAIAENASPLAADTEWVWGCWEWLAAWVAQEPYGDERRKRIERVRALPIVPMDRSLVTASALAGRIVTWRPDSDVGNLPHWLPLTFVDDWLRDRIKDEPEQGCPVKKLSKELGIAPPGADAVRRAVGRAIEQYWKDKQGDPDRFLRFILAQDWHETAVASPLSLRRCPVPLSQPVQGKASVEAEKAYLGREWGNDLLADVYEDNAGVPWVQRVGRGTEKECSILAWLGCSAVPRITKDRGPKGNGIGADQLPEACRKWRTEEFGQKERTPTVDAMSRLEGLAIEELSDTQVRAFLVLLAKHWKEYYEGASRATLSWFYYTKHSCAVRAFWWFEVLHEIRPATKTGSAVSPLDDCWLPDKRTERAIGGLLPVVDLDVFGNDKEDVRKWLVSAGGLRTRIEQLTVKEWGDLLGTRIPDMASTERLGTDERLRDRVTGWYAACLETVAEQEGVPQNAFAPCPLLCQKAGSWQYVAEEPRYLNDDNELARAFAEDVWLFQVPARLAAEAGKYLGIRPLTGAVHIDVIPAGPKSSLSERLLASFVESLPYVWAWRSSQSKHATDKLYARLKALEAHVVADLKAHLSLDGVNREVERRCDVEGDTIYLQADHASEAELAQALAKALDIRSEADFYENLLRCSDGLQRKEKLLSKGMADAEVDRCLREYSGPPAEEEQEEGLPRPVTEERNRDTSQPPSAGGGQNQSRGQASVGMQGGKPERARESSPAGEQQPQHLKDLRTASYVLGSPPEGERGHSGGAPGGRTGEEGRSLTEKERAELEVMGRALVARELEKMGFSVENMPSGNPGFDLRSKKHGEEVRVEVKAHGGRATVVDLTHREYKEYLGQQGYRWELWNVEHLAENDACAVVITRYGTIPDDALDARTFRVDLKKCLSPAHPSSNTE